MERINNDNYIICDICGEMTINGLNCQNCLSKLIIRRNENKLPNKKMNPKYDNIFTLNLKIKFRKEKERIENEIKERERIVKERIEREKYEMEQKKILKEVNDYYNSIKNDLPIPFYLDKNRLDKLILLNKEKCTICLEEFVVKKQVLYLPCSHLFHSICILRWLLNNNKCPICQTDYRAKINDEEKEREEEEDIMEDNFNNNMFMNNINIVFQ